MKKDMIKMCENLIMLGYDDVSVEGTGEDVIITFTAKNNERLSENETFTFTPNINEDKNAIAFNGLITLIYENHYKKSKYDNSNYGMHVCSIFEEFMKKSFRENHIEEFNTKIKIAQANNMMSESEVANQKTTANKLHGQLVALGDDKSFDNFFKYVKTVPFYDVKSFTRTEKRRNQFSF